MCVLFGKPVIDIRAQCLSVWLCQFSAAPCMRSGRGVMGGTKTLFVPLSCISACAACCGGWPLAADEPSGGGAGEWCLGEKGGAAWLTVACGGWGGGGAVTMATWLRKVWGLDAVWLPLPARPSAFDESPPAFNTWTLNKLQWKWGGEKERIMWGGVLILLLWAWRLI